MAACECAHPEEAEVDDCCRDYTGELGSQLHLAAEEGHEAVVCYLLETRVELRVSGRCDSIQAGR